MKAVALLLITWLYMPTTTLAQIYRWVDEEGKVHYSDQAPPDQTTEEITPTHTVNSDSSSGEQKKLGAIFAPETPEEKQLKQQQAAQKRQQEARQKQQCQEAKQLLKQITESPVYLIKADGTERDISKQELQQKQSELQAFITEHC